jgi:outer membrane immunogenic protein
MKKLLLGTVALVALGMGGPAIAADMGARPLAAPVAVTNWTGCYVGGAVGNSWGHSSGYSTTAASTAGIVPPGSAISLAAVGQLSNGFDMTGVTGGFYGGCNYQFGVWVVGAEGDWMANNKEGQAFWVNGPSTGLLTPGLGIASGGIWSLKERWYATARGRLGYAVDKWLFFVTGGGAWVKLDSAEFFTSIVGGGASSGPLATANLQSDRRSGWTVGGGFEYALKYGWSIRSEYLYIKIPSYTTFTPGQGNGTLLTLAPTNLNVDLNNHIWRAGLTYQFGAWGKAPVVAATK